MTSYNAFAAAIIEIGDEGLVANTIKSVPLEPYALKVVTVVTLSCLILLGLYHLCRTMY